MRRALGTQVTTGTTVAVGGTVPLTKYAGRPCNGLSVDSNAIVIKPVGTYSISGYVQLSATETGGASVELYNNGVAIPGTLSEATATAAGDTINFPIKYTLYLAPSCPMNPNTAKITVVVLSGGGTTEAGVIDVESI